MHKIIEHIIIFLAILAAGLLFVFGIRKLNLKKSKKYGIFFTTLMLILGISCQNGQGKNRKNSQIKLNMVNEMKINRTKLFKSNEWQFFKKYWQKLDSIVANEKNNSIGIGPYTNKLSTDEIKEYQKDLSQVFTYLETLIKKELISKEEGHLFQAISSLRLQYITSGFFSMLSHKMPAPMTITKENSIKDLEKKIDLLVVLRKKGDVKQAEFKKAFANIQKEIKNFSLYYLIGSHFFYDIPVEFKLGNADEMLSNFKKSYEVYKKRKEENESGKYSKELDEKYEKAKKLVDQLYKILPGLNQLVANLEQA